MTPKRLYIYFVCLLQCGATRQFDPNSQLLPDQWTCNPLTMQCYKSSALPMVQKPKYHFLFLKGSGNKYILASDFMRESTPQWALRYLISSLSQYSLPYYIVNNVFIELNDDALLSFHFFFDGRLFIRLSCFGKSNSKRRKHSTFVARNFKARVMLIIKFKCVPNVIEWMMTAVCFFNTKLCKVSTNTFRFFVKQINSSVKDCVRKNHIPRLDVHAVSIAETQRIWLKDWIP